MTVFCEKHSVERLKAENRPPLAADWETAFICLPLRLCAPSYFCVHYLNQSGERMLMFIRVCRDFFFFLPGSENIMPFNQEVITLFSKICYLLHMSEQ